MRKTILLSLFLFVPFLSQAQFIENSSPKIEIQEFSFIPDFEQVPSGSMISEIIPKKSSNSFLLGTGWLLQGLKFNSPIDEFNALQPFDLRGFDPVNFSSYSSYIQTNKLLINPVNTLQ